MAITVYVNGYQGRMGRAIVNALEQDPQLSFVGGGGRADDLQGQLQRLKPNVVVDVTSADAGFVNAKTILQSGCHAVMGTTGFSTKDLDNLSEICRQVQRGCLVVPNFSLGAVLMMHCAELAAQYFDSVEIVERHGLHKKDAPSGTAMLTAQKIAKQRKHIVRESESAKELVAGARGGVEKGVSVHSIRLPGSVAHQSVIFGGTGETLTITHDSIHRDAFMPGVMLCCKKVVELQTVVYGMEQLLFDNQ